MIIKWKLLVNVSVDDDFDYRSKYLEADDADRALELAFREVQKVNNSLSDNADIIGAYFSGFLKMKPGEGGMVTSFSKDAAELFYPKKQSDFHRSVSSGGHTAQRTAPSMTDLKGMVSIRSI